MHNYHACSKDNAWKLSGCYCFFTLLVLLLQIANIVSFTWTIGDLTNAYSDPFWRLSHRFLKTGKTRSVSLCKDGTGDATSSPLHLFNQETSPRKSADELIAIGREEFQKFFSFPLDDWQLQAGGAIYTGCNLIVCAPTGAGKTVVGEMALLHAFHVSNQNGIYTTPLKALSNQKYSDLCQIFGRDNTGLSTGDISINKGAQIRVMTTEVYRNMAWRSSSTTTSSAGDNDDNFLGASGEELSQNSVVVLDEFHYMGHPGRGGVWEESVITSPLHTQIVGLSATIANGQALTSWMESVTGRPTLLVEVQGQKRPVPLRFLFATKKGLYPLFRDPDSGPGSLKGLLGYRGDGEPSEVEQSKKREKKKGFARGGDDDDDDEGSGQSTLPRGLQLNPALRSLARQRLQKVMKTLDQWKKHENFRSVGENGSFRMPENLSPREERREKERLLRKEMRREVPSLSVLLSRLKDKGLLPAIFFIFSRLGCDEAARGAYLTMKGPKDPNRLLDTEMDQFDVDPKLQRKRRKPRQRERIAKGRLLEDEDGRIFRRDDNYVSDDVLSSYLDQSSVSLEEDAFDQSSPLAPENWVYYSKAGLLEFKAVQEVASRITLFNEQNPEIAFDDEVAQQFLFGVGSHHAGMLPAHKSFVEILFRRQLMKAVFATETLAAGINMPARTTVVCSMAKRGSGSSMSLLETSNLLQMAGRAGRRGFDTSGTCVIVATPFETHDEAIKILVDPIKPIESQFTPSYSLAVNLIARGNGKLDVARQLVSKSFAAWQKRKSEEVVSSEVERYGEGVMEVLEVSAQERFMNVLVYTLQFQVDNRRARFDVAKVDSLLEILKNREALKKESKSYISLSKAFELEEVTLRYLMKEVERLELATRSALTELNEYGILADEDANDLVNQISVQRKRTEEAAKYLRKHPFTAIASIAQQIISEGSPEGENLRLALAGARGLDSGNTRDVEENTSNFITADELTSYAKSVIVVNRKTRKLSKTNPELDPALLLLEAEKVRATDTSWDDMLAITKTLLSYGCLTTTANTWDDLITDDEALEGATYTLTPAGTNVGMLGFENSLWAMVAIGGAWCVLNDHPKDNDVVSDSLVGETAEAEKLVLQLRDMDAAEFSGYVSAIISETNSRTSVDLVVEQFRILSVTQQRAIQCALRCMDRFLAIQTKHSVDPGTRVCNLDVSNVRVVTAWAGGCSWNEAVQISGLPPGDLVRTLSRVLDAVRQLGNLPFRPVRKGDLKMGTLQVSLGIDPQVRRLCQEAAKAINRYPVKDPLAFETPLEMEEEELEEDVDGF